MDSNVPKQYQVLSSDFEADPILFLIGQIVVGQIWLATPGDVTEQSFVDCGLDDSRADWTVYDSYFGSIRDSLTDSFLQIVPNKNE